MQIHQVGISQNPSWQQMAVIVNQHSDLALNFKKLYLQRLVVENVLVFLLQYCGLTFSTLTPHHFPLWFASGTACAFIFLRGFSILPGVWLGTFFAYYLLKINVCLALASAMIFTLQTFLLFFGCIYLISPTLIFIRRFTLIKFICYAGIITGMTSFLLIFLYHSLLPNQAIFGKVGLECWLANFNGVLIFSFALITWDAIFPQMNELHQLNKKKIMALFGLFSLSIVALVVSETLYSMMLFAGLSMLIMIATSIVYGWCGAISSLVILTMGLVLSVLCSTPLYHFTLVTKSVLSLAIILATLFSFSSNIYLFANSIHRK